MKILYGGWKPLSCMQSFCHTMEPKLTWKAVNSTGWTWSPWRPTQSWPAENTAGHSLVSEDISLSSSVRTFVRSVAVHSMKTFFVVKLIFEWSPGTERNIFFQEVILKVDVLNYKIDWAFIRVLEEPVKVLIHSFRWRCLQVESERPSCSIFLKIVRRKQNQNLGSPLIIGGIDKTTPLLS